MERQQHWDSIYETESVTNVSWYEAEPQASLDLIVGKKSIVASRASRAALAEQPLHQRSPMRC